MLENLLSELKSTSKPLEKQQIIKNHDSDFFRYLIHATYEPFKIYSVRLKQSDVPEPGKQSIEEVEEVVKDLFCFCEDSKSPKQNREKVVAVLSLLNKGSQELLFGTLNKSWKSGLGVRNILKVFPGIVSRFEVQLANTFDTTKTYSFPRVWSYKLDGLRCIAIRREGKWTMYSRKGKEFPTVEHLKPQLENLYAAHGFTFFDGELYKHGLPFEEIQGSVMRFTRNRQAKDIEYHVFIAGDAEVFLRGGDGVYIILSKNLEEACSPMLKFVHRDYIESVDKIEDIIDGAFDKGYEGIMLRDPEQPYDYKRSKALLKLKQGIEQGEMISDCVVEGIECDDFPIIKNGEMLTEWLLVRLLVKQEDGVICKVGSGFNLEFRRRYTKNPDDLIGKVVEVKHQLWGSNERMRFPRLVRVREDL